MKEAPADLWSYPAEYRCITTNGIVTDGLLVMGAGVARQARDRFPHLPVKLGGWVNKYGNRVFVCRDERLITLPTKEDWRRPSPAWLVDRSIQQLVQVVDKYGIRTAVLPRPGCGLGGLDWADVRPLCEFHLDDRFTVVSQ